MGRSHALTLAEAGADVIVVDLADQIESVPYDLARPVDLEETAAVVEAIGGRVIAARVDVREQDQLDQVVQRGIDEFDHIDILIANAGVWSLAPFWDMPEQQWQDMIDVNLRGVWRSAKAVAPHMIERGSSVAAARS